MLSFISLVLFGLVVGVIAKLLMPGRDPGGFIITILLGIAGAVLGGYIGRLMGFYGPNEGAGFFMALLGSIILLAIYRLTLRRGTAV
jgi:Predicted membrane protein